MSTTTIEQAKKQAAAIVQAAVAIGESIKALKTIPSGHLYAQLMGKMSLEVYNHIIGLLVGAGQVKLESHVLTWK
jgi:hypothetical protein